MIPAVVAAAVIVAVVAFLALTHKRDDDASASSTSTTTANPSGTADPLAGDPNGPVNVNATRDGDHITVTWDPAPSGPPSGFVVRGKPEGNRGLLVEPYRGGKRRLILQPTDPELSYCVWVTAIPSDPSLKAADSATKPVDPEGDTGRKAQCKPEGG